MTLPQQVKIVEVGPRDGLQNEKEFVPTATKIELINRLSAAGFRNIEAASFVSPKWVPQMADGADVMAGIERRAGTIYSVLTPNLRGFEGALAARADEIVIFGAASEAFSQRNINCSIAESIDRFAPVAEAAKQHGVRIRGSVSCALGCPYQGEVPVASVVDVVERFAALGWFRDKDSNEPLVAFQTFDLIELFARLTPPGSARIRGCAPCPRSATWSSWRWSGARARSSPTPAACRRRPPCCGCRA